MDRREYDAEIDLQYNRARYYDPGTGRWISQDPLGFGAGDSNLYRYCFNKPTEASDPSGFYQQAPAQDEQEFHSVWEIRLVHLYGLHSSRNTVAAYLEIGVNSFKYDGKFYGGGKIHGLSIIGKCINVALSPAKSIDDPALQTKVTGKWDSFIKDYKEDRVLLILGEPQFKLGKDYSTMKMAFDYIIFSDKSDKLAKVKSIKDSLTKGETVNLVGGVIKESRKGTIIFTTNEKQSSNADYTNILDVQGKNIGKNGNEELLEVDFATFHDNGRKQTKYQFVPKK